MRRNRTSLLALGLVAAVIALPACSPKSSSSSSSGGKDSGSQVEVFSWWAGPGEKEGLDAMIADFTQQYPTITFDNAAVAAGSPETGLNFVRDEQGAVLSTQVERVTEVVIVRNDHAFALNRLDDERCDFSRRQCPCQSIEVIERNLGAFRQ